MKRPTWATIVGILGIFFGLIGLLTSAQTTATPKIIQFQKEMLGKMEQSAQVNSQSAVQFEQSKKIFDSFLGKVPKWFGTAMVIIGIIGLVINAIYIFASIALLLVKSYAIRLFYTTVMFSIGMIITKTSIIAVAFSSMGISMLLSGLIGAIIDIILLIVVATGNKEAFKAMENATK